MDLTLHLTHACTLRCDYCYAGEKTPRAMSPEVLRRALELGLREAQGALAVTFFGGEPLLRRDLIELALEEARARAPRGTWLSFRVVTNGTLLDDDTIGFLAEQGIHVALSLDGVREAHDRHRRAPDGSGSFARVAEALPRLLRRIPYASVVTVVTPETAPLLPRSLAYLLDQGVRFLLTTLDYAAAWTPRAMAVLRRAYEKVARDYVRRTLRGDKLFLACLDGKIATRTRGAGGERERCSVGRRQLSVAPSGRLYPCVQFVGGDGEAERRYLLGDVERGIDEARRRALREEAERPKAACAGCAIADRCASWCACVNGRTTGQLDRVCPALCAHERMLVEVADRAAERLYRARARGFLRKHYDDAHALVSCVEDELLWRAAQERSGRGERR